MGTYISLVNWTDQGVRNIKESPGRLDAARRLAKKYGCEMTHFFMTIGAYDMVAMLEAPDDESAAKFSLALASAGSALRLMLMNPHCSAFVKSSPAMTKGWVSMLVKTPSRSSVPVRSKATSSVIVSASGAAGQPPRTLNTATPSTSRPETPCRARLRFQARLPESC